MYAIIRAGGKQAKVREGDVIDVERIKGGTAQVTFTPLLLVDDDGNVVSERDTLAQASVTAEVVGESRGPKIDVFTYKNKSGSRRRQGHRQTYTTLQVTGITLPGGKAPAAKRGGGKAAEEKSADEKASADEKVGAGKKAAAQEKATGARAADGAGETVPDQEAADKKAADKKAAMKAAAQKTATEPAADAPSGEEE